jgi:hypothetical protein
MDFFQGPNALPLPSRAEINAYNEMFFAPKILGTFHDSNTDTERILYIQSILHEYFPNNNYQFVRNIYDLRPDRVLIFVGPQSRNNAITTLCEKMKNYSFGRKQGTLRNMSDANVSYSRQDWIYKKVMETSINNMKLIRQAKTTYHYNDELIQEFDDTWPWYSMINTIFEPVDFILYSGSHMVQPGKKVHEITKVRLRFPKDRSFMLLFHGKLLHNGARALPESDISSFHYKNSLRQFSYVNKLSSSHNNQTIPRLRTRSQVQQSQGIRVNVNTTRNICGFCSKCQKLVKNKYKKTWSHLGASNAGCIDINIDVCYHIWLDRKNQAINDRLQSKTDESMDDEDDDNVSDTIELTPIAGNLQRDGWVVYNGVDVYNMKKYGNLRFELGKTLKNPFRRQWNSIHTDDDIAARQQIKLHELDLMNYREDIKSIFEFMEDVKNNVLLKVPGFQNAHLDSHQLLRNVGCVGEQSPHSDYDYQ